MRCVSGEAPKRRRSWAPERRLGWHNVMARSCRAAGWPLIAHPAPWCRLVTCRRHRDLPPPPPPTPPSTSAAATTAGPPPPWSPPLLPPLPLPQGGGGGDSVHPHPVAPPDPVTLSAVSDSNFYPLSTRIAPIGRCLSPQTRSLRRAAPVAAAGPIRMTRICPDNKFGPGHYCSVAIGGDAMLAPPSHTYDENGSDKLQRNTTTPGPCRPAAAAGAWGRLLPAGPVPSR